MFHYNLNIGNNIQISKLLEFCGSESKLVDIQERLRDLNPELGARFTHRLRFFFRSICFQAGLFCNNILDKRCTNYEISILRDVLNGQRPDGLSPIVYEVARANLADLCARNLTVGEFTLLVKRDPYMKEKLTTMLKYQHVSCEDELMQLLENKIDFIRHCLGHPPTNTYSRLTVEDIRSFIDMDALQANWATPQPIDMKVFSNKPWVPLSYLLPIVPQEPSLEADFLRLNQDINDSILEIQTQYAYHKSAYLYYDRIDPNYVPTYIIEKIPALHEMQQRIKDLIQRHQALVQKYEGFPKPELPADLQTCYDFIKKIIEKHNMYLLETLVPPSPSPRSPRY